MDLALNNLQRFICYKIQPIQIIFNIYIYIYIYKKDLAIYNLQWWYAIKHSGCPPGVMVKATKVE